MTCIPLNHAVKYKDRWLQITMLFLINYMKHRHSHLEYKITSLPLCFVLIDQWREGATQTSGPAGYGSTAEAVAL